MVAYEPAVAPGSRRCRAPRAGAAGSCRPDSVGPGGGPFVAVVLGVSGVEGADAVIVQQWYAVGYDTVTDAAEALLVAVPVLVLVVGAMTYVLTGRALRPVEQIRRKTCRMLSEADLGTRIDVPPTGDEVHASRAR